MAIDDTSPRPGDTENKLLQKILTVLRGEARPGDTNAEIEAKIILALQTALSDGSSSVKAYVDAQDALRVLKAGDTMTGALAFSTGTLTSSNPSITDSPVWNEGTTAFTGWKFNVTNTASSANSLFYDYQVSGESRANFSIGGTARFIRHTADDSALTLILRKRGRTGDVDGAIANDAQIGSIAASGWNGSANFTGAFITALAEEAWTNLVGGTRLVFQTTVQGSQTMVNALIIRSASIDLPTGSALRFGSGANARAGNADLSGGTKAVSNTTVTANTVIILCVKSIGGTPGTLSYTLNPGVGFTINSSSGTDTSTVSYLLVEA